jgi:ABC-type sugar transport system permease subunit/ABC-type glycerol-3-phosphate transport system substrate-binding protein
MKARCFAAIFLVIGGALSARATELRVWQMTLRPRTAAAIAAQYELKHPGVHVAIETLSWDDALQKLVLAIASHHEPDVLELGSTWIPQFRAAGSLAIVPDADAAGLLLTQPGQSPGGTDAVPWILGTRALFVNPAMLRAAGIDHAPRNTEELLGDCVRLRNVAPASRCIGLAASDTYAPWQQLLSFAWSRNPNLFGDSVDASDVNGPEVLAAARFYSAIRPYALADVPSALDGQFATGAVPMVISGSWLPQLLRNTSPGLDYQVVPIPALAGGQPRGFAGGEYLSVSARSQHADLARSFIAYLLEPSALATIIEAQPGLLPARRGVELPADPSRPDAATRAARRALQSILETAVAPPSDPRWAASEQPLSSIVDHILLEGDTPEVAIRKAVRVLEPALRLADYKHSRQADDVIRWIEAAGLAAALLLILWPGRKTTRWTRLPLVPWWVLFLAIYLLPGIFVFVISGTSYDLLSARIVFTGARNFINLASSPSFRHSLLVTSIFVITSVPITLLMALAAAYGFQKLRRFRRIAELSVYLPPLLPVVVTATVFGALFVGSGPVDWLLGRAGIPVPSPSWLLNPWAAMCVVVVHAAWTSFGYYAIFFSVSLASIPLTVLDAVALDGATGWLRFRSIEWPVLRPTVLLVLLLHSVRSFQVFPEIFIMTRGGPAGATTTVVYQLYDLAFRTFDFGAASAVAVVLMLITLVIVFPFVARSGRTSS